VKKKTNVTIKLTSSFTVSAVPELEKSVADLVKSADVTVQKGLSYGEVEVIVSNSGLDRHGEQIIMEGIDISQIKRNPVVLWAHEYSGLPIGQIVKLWKSNGNLMARLKLDYDIYDFADTVYKMILRGTISAVSIGGMVKEWNEDYTIIKKMEMLELSVVPVGAHPDALVTAKSLGIRFEDFQKQYDTFVHKSLIDKFKNMPENEIQNHIGSLKALLSALEDSPKEVSTKENDKQEPIEVKQKQIIVIKIAEKNGGELE